jgi:dienelactone hydrolase
MQVQELSYAHGGTPLRGYLAYDENTVGKRPGVIVAPEAPGLTEHAKRRVRMLADLGYVALGLDLYGNGRFVEKMDEMMGALNALRSDLQLWRGRITAAFNTLQSHERVDPTRMAAIGYCFGGSSVLELARSGADVKAVVSFHGELKASPHAPGGITAKLLVCHAAQDAFASSADVIAFEEEMTAAKTDWQVITYGGAKHGFTSRESDHAGMPAIAYQEAADRRSWKAMQDLLSEACKN